MGALITARTKWASLAAVLALLATWISVATPAVAAAKTCGDGTPTTSSGTFRDGATYLISCPATWNGTLFLYSHGYVIPGTANPAADTGDVTTGNWLLAHGYALAGSSYATTGWAVRSALIDQEATLKLFDRTFGRPARTIAWGHSLGGMITAALVQQHPADFDGALAVCGVLAGGVATWNTSLDAAVAFKTLLASGARLQVVDISDPTENLAEAESLLRSAQTTPQGRARVALVAALADVPGWFAPGSSEPSSKAYGAEEENQFLWASAVDFPFLFDYRAELESEAGGNPSWDTGVDFTKQLALSTDHDEVVALYRAAGLRLGTDLAALQRAARVRADPRAVSYLRQNISFDGRLAVPVLTLHTTGDGLVVPENEAAYRRVVVDAGKANLLRQLFVARAGHCSFTPAETIVAIEVLLKRIATGSWDDGMLAPSRLNARAAGLGPGDNRLALTPEAPAFTSYSAPPYLRPSPAAG